MDVLLIFYSVLLTALLYFEGVSSFQAGQLVLSPELPVLGDGDFTLKCTFSLSSNAELLQGLTFHRKRTEDSSFSLILTIPPPSVSTAPIRYNDSSLEARTIITKPDTSLSTSVSIIFNSTECSDIGEYKLKISYYSDGYIDIERIVDVKVKVDGTFDGTGYGITVSPGYDVSENTNVTVTCKADVGAEPQGQLEWYYYKGVTTGTAYPISNYAIKGNLETVRGCSHTQVSTLTLPMNENFNNIVVRCTLQQDVPNPNGDDHKQTQSPFNVTYSPRRTVISRNPDHPSYSEDAESLTLTCSSAGNPPPSFTWLLPNGTEVSGATYELQNLQLNDTGNYTCMAKNGIPNENFTDTNSTELRVEKTTTPASTTSPSASVTSPKPTGAGGPTEPSTDKDSDKTNIIIIAVCVAVAVIIIIVIIVICYCSRKNKKNKEIEEPPEKPRNNQDLNFSGYRPGLTTSTDSLKNSGNNLNTSFNSFESSDSKPRNEDGLNYVDLQFDDRPRSRRPIQVYDNGTSTQYADIAMPRV